MRHDVKNTQWHLVGGAGYVGSRLHARLLERGARDIRVIDPVEPAIGGDGVSPATHSICVYLAWPRKREQDLMTTKQYRESLEEHLALIDTWSLDVDRLVFVSTVQTNARRPSPYGVAKGVSANHVAALPNGVVVQFGTVFGPSPRMRWDLILNRMLLDALTVHRVTEIDGHCGRYLTPIEEACDVLIAAALGDSAPDHLYRTTVAELAAMVSSVTGGKIVKRIEKEKTVDIETKEYHPAVRVEDVIRFSNWIQAQVGDCT